MNQTGGGRLCPNPPPGQVGQTQEPGVDATSSPLRPFGASHHSATSAGVVASLLCSDKLLRKALTRSASCLADLKEVARPPVEVLVAARNPALHDTSILGGGWTPPAPGAALVGYPDLGRVSVGSRPQHPVNPLRPVGHLLGRRVLVDVVVGRVRVVGKELPLDRFLSMK